MDATENPAELVPAEAAELVQQVVRRPADQHPAQVYLARLGEGSRRTMRGALETMARHVTAGACGLEQVPWHALRYQHAQALRTWLADKYAPSTANKHLAALRGVLRESWRLGYVDAETYHRAVDLEPVRGHREPAGREVSAAEARSMFESCADEDSPAGARDAALLAVLYGAGLRRAEAVGLTLEDYDRETGALVVNGKGNKQRKVYVTNEAQDALEDWLAVRGDEPGALLTPVTTGGRVVLRPMSAQALMLRVQRRAELAGLRHLTPHDLRRSFAGDLLDAGSDLVAVQELMGHSSPTTTARYDRRGERAKRKAAELRHVPYRRAGVRA